MEILIVLRRKIAKLKKIWKEVTSSAFKWNTHPFPFPYLFWRCFFRSFPLWFQWKTRSSFKCPNEHLHCSQI